MEFNIFSLSSWLVFGLYTLWFVLAVFLACYIPAAVILKDTFSKHSQFEKCVIFISFGLILWAGQGMIFGYPNARTLSYLYLLTFFLLWRPIRLLEYKKFHLPKISKCSLALIILFMVGIYGQVNRFIPTGFIFPKGIYIFTPASDDAFWHAALTDAIVRRFPPTEPGLSGIAVYNYHYWSNLVNAEFVRVFKLPLLTTQFVYSYILGSFLLGGLAVVISRMLKFSNLGIFIAVYLQYFASDIIYLTSLVTTGKFEFHVHPLEDGTMFWENPPRAFSIIAVLLGLILLMKFVKTNSLRLGLLTAVVFGTVIGFKVHTGIMVLIAISVLGLHFLFKRNLRAAAFCLLTILISAVVYLPVNRASGLPVFSPFEMPRMFAVQDKLKLSFLELRRRIYGDHRNWLRVWEMDIIMLVIFMLSQFGIRNIGWLSLKRAFKTLGTPIFIFVFTGAVGSIAFGSLFVQPVAWADIFNSYLAASLMLWILTIIMLNHWLENKNKIFKIFLIGLMVVFTVPRWIYKTAYDFRTIPQTIPVISRGELTAANFVRTHSDEKSVIWVSNSGQWDSVFPYVSIFTNRDMFLSGQSILGRHGIPYNDRTQVSKLLLTNPDPVKDAEILSRNHISYLYFYGDPKLPVGLSLLPLVKVFHNGTNTIYYYNGNNL